MAKKRTRKKKIYKTKAEAERAKDRQGGSNRIYKVVGGYRMTRA